MAEQKNLVALTVSLGGAAVIAGGAIALRAITRRELRAHGIERANLPALAELDSAPAPTLRQHQLRARDGAMLHVIDSGSLSAPIVVLLHGVTLCGELWHHQLSSLASDFRVLAPDWRGHHRSSVGSEGFGLEVLARDLREILEHFDVRNAVLVGHSMGGMALMRFCIDHRDALLERARGMAFVDTAIANVATGLLGGVAGVLAPIARQMPRLAGAYGKAARGDLGYQAAKFAFGLRPDPVAVEQTRQMLVRMDPLATGASTAALLGHDCRKGMGSVLLPTLVVVGDHDRVTPLVKAEEIVSTIPGAQLRVIAGAGHLPMLERPQELDAVLRAFIAELPA